MNSGRAFGITDLVIYALFRFEYVIYYGLTLFKLLFGEESTTFKYKWLRAMHSEGFTGVHVDWVYMGRGSRNLLTCWIPLGFETYHMQNYFELLIPFLINEFILSLSLNSS